MIEKKKCTKCEIEKFISEFCLRNDKKRIVNKHRSECKSCHNSTRYKYRDFDKRYNDKCRLSGLYKGRYNKLREWRKNNPEKAREKNRNSREKFRQTPKGMLINRMSSRINQSLIKGKMRKHWESLVGYTIQELKEHLEKQFLTGMTWGNRDLWHIDHKIPIAAFNFEKPEDIDFKKCWALKNLRPLWARDNSVKQDKLEQAFQPSLKLRTQSKQGQSM